MPYRYLELALAYCRRRFVKPPLKSRVDASSTIKDHARANGSARPPPPLPPLPSFTQLPTEVIERISDFLFEIRPPKLDAGVNGKFLSTKPSWEDVCGFMTASMDLHKMGYIRWIQIITVKSPTDWEYLVPDAHLIRELRIVDEALGSAHKRVLSSFENLSAVSINSHDDISQNGGQFAYRNVVTAFPPSLRRLEIVHAHGPDIKVIATVKEHCSSLEHLRLGRCTIFNRADPCAFWSSYPFDHDSYLSSEGTEEYAHSLAQELAPLKKLKSIRMGLYLVPSSIVLAHRLYHRRGLPAPAVIEWQQAIPLAEIPELAEAELEQEPQREAATTAQLVSLLHQPDPETEFGPGHNCALCTELTSQITEDAERSANAILSNLVPSLKQIEWMGWLTPKHLGVHTYTLK